MEKNAEFRENENLQCKMRGKNGRRHKLKVKKNVPTFPFLKEFEYSNTHLLSKFACLVRIILYFIIKYREVQCQPKPDRMGRRQLNSSGCCFLISSSRIFHMF